MRQRHGQIQFPFTLAECFGLRKCRGRHAAMLASRAATVAFQRGDDFAALDSSGGGLFDLRVALCQRCAQVVHVLLEQLYARGACIKLAAQIAHVLNAGAQLALHARQTLIAIIDVVIKATQQAVKY